MTNQDPPPAQRQLAREHVDRFLDAIAATGADLDDAHPALYNALTGALNDARTDRRLAAQEGEKISGAQWATARGYVRAEQAAAQLGLSAHEWHTAYNLIMVVELFPPNWKPGAAAFYDVRQGLTTEQRTEIASKTMLTRTQAAERLGMSPAQFDRLKAKAGLQRADQAPSPSGYPVYLYRQTEIDALKP